MFRYIGLLRDPRVLVIVVVGIGLRFLLEGALTDAVTADVEAYEARQASMSPEERAADDLARLERLAALAPGAPTAVTPPPPPAPIPWLAVVVGAVVLLGVGVGGYGAWRIWTRREEDVPEPPAEPGA